MTMLHFKEAAKMARKIVHACTEVSKYHYAQDFVIAAFEETIKSAERTNQSADTQTDYFDDGFSLLREAVRVAGAWQDFWSDVHHNGQPTRWLKISRRLVLQGKTESILVLKEHSGWSGRDPDAIVEEKWELHRRDRRHLEKQVDDPVYERIREEYLPDVQAEKSQWLITPFSIKMRSGMWLEFLGRNENRLDNAFYAFVFPGLEILG
ncbi:MAG: hypothetical protein ACP5SH_17130, partial [Syntrophobacteraceae bacterium]